MRSIRLLPVVVVAALALLVLKGFSLLTEGSYVLTGMELVQAQDEGASPEAQAEEPVPAPTLANPAQTASEERTGIGITEDQAAAADRASEELFSRAGPAPINSTQLDAVPFEMNKAGEKVPLANSDGSTDTEKAVLERLSDRRAELDLFENELRARQAVVEAAERRLGERVDQLKLLEEQINALVERKKAADDEQFKGLVSMYETMKPKDAANIFDQLGDDVLYRVAISMNPRKMAPILAEMAPARAQELTTLMAAQEPEPTLDEAGTDLTQLPQIVGQ
ncbi:MAG: hypothetical protein KKH72_14395 [Alphaproteobacteria bacterium]|nr:hypothetical protein [Alphaproteobacteria bacterium]